MTVPRKGEKITFSGGLDDKSAADDAGAEEGGGGGAPAGFAGTADDGVLITILRGRDESGGGSLVLGGGAPAMREGGGDGTGGGAVSGLEGPIPLMTPIWFLCNTAGPVTAGEGRCAMTGGRGISLLGGPAVGAAVGTGRLNKDKRRAFNTAFFGSTPGCGAFSAELFVAGAR
jgi:hypothetical protein